MPEHINRKWMQEFTLRNVDSAKAAAKKAHDDLMEESHRDIAGEMATAGMNGLFKAECNLEHLSIDDFFEVLGIARDHMPDVDFSQPPHCSDLIICIDWSIKDA